VAETEDERGEGFLEPAEVAPLLDALGDPAAEIRAVMFEALARLPLARAEWMTVARFGAQAAKPTSSREERLALVDVAPWVPVRSIREHVRRLAKEDEDEGVRARALEATTSLHLDETAVEATAASALHPVWAAEKPPGFTWYSASERASSMAQLAVLSAPLDQLQALAYPFTLNAQLMAPVLERDLVPIAVTALFARARNEGFFWGNNIVGWVEEIQGQFRPDVEGLFREYWRTALAECERSANDQCPGAWFLWFPDFEDWSGYRSLGWQIGWTVSRGGLHGLVPALASHLRAADTTERIAAALLIADAADYVLRPDAPIFGGGEGPQRRVRVTGFLPEEPEGALQPAALRRALREAAVQGVVPVTGPSKRPTYPARDRTALEREHARRAELERQRQSWEQATRQRAEQEAQQRSRYPAPSERRRAYTRSRSPLLLRFALPLVLFGGTVVAAKWLFGWFVDLAEAATDVVECTVFSPAVAAPGASILVQAFVHLPEDADDARALAMEFDTAARKRTFRTLTSPIRVGSRLHFELRMPGLEIDDPVAALIWHRRAEAVQFGVFIPPDVAAGEVIGTLAVSLDSAPLGHVKFKLTVDEEARSTPSEPQGEEASRHKVAFISYASKDRDEVMRRVQMLSLVGIEYFQDVLSLEPGDRFSKRIQLGIDECDLFLLFWSRDAKASEWVRKEVRHALSRKAGDDLSPPEIRPVILEGPPIVEPWEELAHLHFNDRHLYFMRQP
jgi:hypothetical protein